MDYKQFRSDLIWAAIWVSIAGSILHFVYDWSGQNWLVGFFGATNESTWEHMKILFWPMLVAAVYLILKWKAFFPGVEAAMLVGIKAAIWHIPTFFYTYQGILGYGIMWIDIAIFYISIVLAVCIILHMMKYLSGKDWGFINVLLRITAVMEVFAFLWFTYRPPSLGIFTQL